MPAVRSPALHDEAHAINFNYLAQMIAVVGAGFLAQPITELFGASSLSVWPSSIVNIFTTVLTPPVSQAADYWGRKWFLAVLMSFGFAGSLVIGRATSISMVIGGFCLVGLSFGSQSLIFAVVSEVLPRKHRPIAQGTANTGAGLAAVIALLMGGTLLRQGDLEKYRVYWYVIAALYLASVVLCIFFYNPPPFPAQSDLTTREKLKRIDWFGIAVFSSGLSLFCVALSWSNNPYSWSDPHVLGPFIIGIVLLVIFVVYEWRWNSEGMLHHGLFQRLNFPLSLAIAFAEGLSFFICNNYFAFQIDTPPELISITSGLMTATRSLRATIGLAIYSGIINHTVAQNLVPKISTATLSLGLPKDSLPAVLSALESQSTSAMESIPGVTPEIIMAALAAFKDVYGIAFRNTWITAACFVFVAIIVAIFLTDPSSEFNSKVDAPAEKKNIHSKLDPEIQQDAEKGASTHAHIETIDR
ncbi:siderophore iron transporter [Penicillium lividum]|nr:siderophore iron transporter [Penicillium lividum]